MYKNNKRRTTNIWQIKCKYRILIKTNWLVTNSVLSVDCYKNKNNQFRPKINSLTNCVFYPSPCFCNNLLQDQLKFVYDTLEEFIVCGYTYFPVKDLSHHLKQKSVRKPGRKNNDYEREYAVRTTKNYRINEKVRMCSSEFYLLIHVFI